jgi:MoxR-like ATPase
MNSQLQYQIKECLEKVQAIKREIQNVIVGQDEIIRLVLIALFANGHVLLEGVPGLGKTMLIRTLGQVLDLHFSRIQFTPDLMPADIIGTEILSNVGEERSFHFQPGPIFANLVLADEINRAPPKTQSALLEAMQEKTVTVAKKTYSLEPPFFVMATQNPLEMDGTYPLPEAQMDRFFFKVMMHSPNETTLSQIFDRTTGHENGIASKITQAQDVLAIERIARQVVLPSHVNQFVARLITRTHPRCSDCPQSVKQYIRYGASPRGGQSIILGAKVNALLEGRYNVAFDDINAVTHAALRHRILPNFEGIAEDIDLDYVITEIIESTPIEI